MMLNKRVRMTKIKLVLDVEQQLVDRFDQVRRAAEEQGYDVQIEGAVAVFLAGQITRAERLLFSQSNQ